jgi:hypothetical protein
MIDAKKNYLSMAALDTESATSSGRDAVATTSSESLISAGKSPLKNLPVDNVPYGKVNTNESLSEEPAAPKIPSKLNKPWKRLRTYDELEQKSKEIFSLDKDPVKALNKALLMPEFFTQKKNNVEQRQKGSAGTVLFK